MSDSISALTFYANPANWREIETGIGMMPSEADSDGGEKAREAIAALSKGDAVPRILNECAAIYEQRNAVYKDNFINVGKAMKAFFPNGVTLKTEADFMRWHIFELIIVKITRLVNSDFENTDAIRDNINYFAILERIITEFKNGPE